MLEFIIGRAGSGKTRTCLNDIAAELRENPLGSPLVLLTPEHMTYKAERELAALTGGFVRAYVFGFRRFAHRVLSDVGGLALPRITDIGRRMILRRILAERQDKLKFFGRAAKARGFGDTLSAGLDELKNYALTPEDLIKAQQKILPPDLKAKLEDLSLLSADYAAAMAGRMTDGADMLNTLAERLPQAEFMRGAEVWVDGFIFFNPQERKILTALMQICPKLHITLAMQPDVMARDNQRPTGLFHRSWETMDTLQKAADELSVPVTVKPLRELRRFVAPSLAAAESELFKFAPQPTAETTGLNIIEAANRRLEAETVAADILRLCREKNYRYRHIGVLVREESYFPLLARVFAAYNIPFFQAGKREGVHHPLAELLRSTPDILATWQYEPIFRALRTGFFPLTEEQTDLLENYALEFGLRGKKVWLAEEDWHWERRTWDSEADAVSPRREYLEQINALRRTVVQPLKNLAQKFTGRLTVRQMTAALYEFLQELNVPDTLVKWAERDTTAGRLAEAAEHRQIWQDITELLDQLVAAGGEEMMSRAEYEQILAEGLEALSVSLIPPGLDYVSVSAFDQNSLDNSRAIYIMGVNEGIMPRRAREKGLFTDAERLRLKEAGLDISSGGLEGILAEKYLLYRGFTNAREYLCVSYALSGGEMGLSPSSLVKTLRRIAPHGGFMSIPLETWDDSAKLTGADRLQLAYAPMAISKMAAAFRAKGEGRAIQPWWQDVYNWSLNEPKVAAKCETALAGLLAKPHSTELTADVSIGLFSRRGRVRGSVTRFEGFRNCPFQHFAKYGLKLQERRLYRFRAPDLGTLLHELLRRFGEQLKREGRRWSTVSETEADNLCHDLVTELAPKLMSNILASTHQYKHQTERIEQVARHSIERLIAWDKVGAFHPEVYECSFGAGSGMMMPPLTYDLSRGQILEIVGQIDRLDMDETGRYFLIVDYKTGQAAINLAEVYYGLRLQLLTYLLAARNYLTINEQDKLPAAMLYFFLRYPLLTAERHLTKDEARAEVLKKLALPGWVLLDQDVIKAVDPTGQFFRLRLKNDGSPYNADRPKVKTSVEFAYLLEYVEILLADTGNRIMAGEIAPWPIRTDKRIPCTYCPYGSLCGFDLKLDGFAYRNHEKITEDIIMEKIKKICDSRRAK